MPSHPDAVSLSQEFLLAVRRGESTGEYRCRLRTLDPDELEAPTDVRDRRAFWLNVYNAVAQLALADVSSLRDRRWWVFRQNAATVAGERLSLDDIEHGLLRGSMLSWGLGYLPRFRPSAFERTHRIPLDPRIHFALNCGAESCPPIAVYTPENLDHELDLASGSYLGATVEYDAESGVALVPRLFSWYRGDFGGRAGIVAFLQYHEAIPRGSDPRLRYDAYDWSLALGHFAERSDTSPARR